MAHFVVRHPRNAAKEEGRALRKLGSRMAARFKTNGLTADLLELRDQRMRGPEEECRNQDDPTMHRDRRG